MMALAFELFFNKGAAKYTQALSRAFLVPPAFWSKTLPPVNGINKNKYPKILVQLSNLSEAVALRPRHFHAELILREKNANMYSKMDL